jgi:hypothetical protein
MAKGSLGRKDQLAWRLLGSLLVLAALLFAARPTGAADLPRLNIDAGGISVSGLSSGGYMAVQFEVAYSSLVMGAAVIAGGPYYCAQGRLEIASPNCVCVPILACTFVPTTRHVPHLIDVTDRNAHSGAIDPTANLRGHESGCSRASSIRRCGRK